MPHVIFLKSGNLPVVIVDVERQERRQEESH